MSTFQPGETVDITIKGARVHRETAGPGFCVFVMDGGCHTIFIDSANVTVERVAPAEWPPRPGDLWQEVDGALWFAQSLGGSQMAFIPARVRGALDSSLPAYVLETFGPLTLVHREDEQDGSDQ